VKDLEDYQDQPKAPRKKLENKVMIAKRMAIEEARTAKDECNRYTVYVRGATPDVYGILDRAGIVKEFATFLEVTMPLPIPADTACQTMWPLENFTHDSAHTAWMVEYVRELDDEEEIEVDEESSEMITS
jgi:hypothetical protein